MQGETPVSKYVTLFQPIVLVTAKFDNGMTVVGGVLKSAEPEEYNIKFMWVYGADGQFLTSVDVSDHEDFRFNGYVFNLNDDETIEYTVEIKEQD